MTESSSMVLLGLGGAGCAMAGKIKCAFPGEMRAVLADTDVASAGRGDADTLFVLLGGDRLAGRGAGGDIVSARLAAEDSAHALDEPLAGARLAVIVTALGGGTGSGATHEILRHLSSRGIVSIVFATTPFAFEGEMRHRNARGMLSMISDAASASFFIPLDKLVGDAERMEEAMRHAIDALAQAVTMFWHLAEKPGYIALDAERLRKMAQMAGRGRFAVATVSGPDRAAQAVSALSRNPLLADGTSMVRTILCGVLGGEDLRLAEIAEIAKGLKASFGDRADFELATVNDEATFGGSLSIVAMLFESRTKKEAAQGGRAGARRAHAAGRAALLAAPQGKGRFNNASPTVWDGQDLDTPTYQRQNIVLEF